MSRGEREHAEPLIRATDLSVELGGNAILDGIDLAVDRGTFVGLIGPNGAGKTTLLKTVNGSLTPSRGRVEVDGENVHALSSKATSRLVATVPQNTSLTFDFDVRQTVRMGRTPHRSRLGGWRGGDESAVERALERTRTTEFADRTVSDLSGGERQRVLIARALAQETPLLLLDEPTASLDINHQVRTLELVRELVGEGKTAVAAIHDLNLAAHYCDELLLLSGGRVVATGPPESVLTEAHLEDAFGANAVVARHPVTGSVYVTALPDRSVSAGGESRGRVHVVGGGGTAARHLYLLSAAGYDVSVGALNEGDTDTETARSLGIEAVTVDPFSPVDDEAEASVAERVAAADCVVVADVEVGMGNLANLRAAAGAERLVLVEERPFAERNYAGEAGEEAYRTLRERGVVVSSKDVLAAVSNRLGGRGDGGDGTSRDAGEDGERRNGESTPASDGASVDSPFSR
ncbi:cobalamin/Fe3+-siderophore ABC transporter ATPase [Halogeometricum pallidum JCM 14848]|uniref:Cobalamin import ATP-binding protein BtuD n=1 Tax=Halogeometricum pallidum JCM 14848 TaxID=1227487 RepID=M0CTZ2_HALPD|nr:heme ABC transporter ATP-binding protein [Halogeometricum pallidum]ELZ26681.1 cobalamin/Fe3+-siderophore ABC transporter ATPase [Halogeometricum pallidum JCM 14848]